MHAFGLRLRDVRRYRIAFTKSRSIFKQADGHRGLTCHAHIQAYIEFYSQIPQQRILLVGALQSELRMSVVYIRTVSHLTDETAMPSTHSCRKKEWRSWSGLWSVFYVFFSLGVNIFSPFVQLGMLRSCVVIVALLLCADATLPNRSEIPPAPLQRFATAERQPIYRRFIVYNRECMLEPSIDHTANCTQLTPQYREHIKISTHFFILCMEACCVSLSLCVVVVLQAVPCACFVLLRVRSCLVFK